jgi:hypothetical protein
MTKRTAMTLEQKETMMKRINFLSKELDTRRIKVEQELAELETICQEIINIKGILDSNDKQDNGE